MVSKPSNFHQDDLSVPRALLEHHCHICRCSPAVSHHSADDCGSHWPLGQGNVQIFCAATTVGCHANPQGPSGRGFQIWINFVFLAALLLKFLYLVLFGGKEHWSQGVLHISIHNG